MSSPYINTKLMTMVSLRADQMDNNLYNHLKNNLNKKVLGKCFRNYGYIMKIYEITEYSNGLLVPENLKADAVFDVTFSCKLCHPLVGKSIICKIQEITRLMMSLKNGPINIIVDMKRINQELFSVNSKGQLIYKGELKPREITKGMFCKIKIISKGFNDGEDFIMSIGYLEDIANDEEIKNSYDFEYKDEDEIIDIDEYLSPKKTEESSIAEDLLESKEETEETE